MNETKQAEEIIRRIGKYGIHPGAQYRTLADALLGVLDAVDAKIDEMKTDREKGNKDYTDLMERYDAQAVEINKAREVIQLLLSCPGIAEADTQGPWACSHTAAAIKKANSLLKESPNVKN